MGIATPIIMLVIIAVIVALVLDHYGNRKTFPWYVSITCFVAYFIPFSIIVILPLDLVSTQYRACLRLGVECIEPHAHVAEDVLLVFWNVAYWIMFNVQMFVVPIMQGYVRSGNTRFLKRVADGIRENLYFYAGCGGAGVVGIIYAIYGLQVRASVLIDLAIPLANAYGLVLLTLLMGYGLIEVPRGLWFNADTKWVLRFIESSVIAKKEAAIEYEAEVYETARIIAIASKKIDLASPLRPLLDLILKLCPLSLQDRNAGTNLDSNETLLKFDEKQLVVLHARIKAAVFMKDRENAKVRTLLRHAYLCQDIIESYDNPSRELNSAFLPSIIPQISPVVWSKANWWLHVWVKPIMMRITSIALFLLSLMVIWSESTFQLPVHVSIPQLLIESSTVSYATLEVSEI